MECTNIKQLLSEYLDSALDEDRKRLVEEHLSTCRKCSEELESLRAYITALNSLEKVETPDNFLEKVHERLKPRRGFKGIAHKLFVPVRIKIPLELVGAAALVILIIYIVNTRQPMGKIAGPKDLSGAAVKEEREKPIEVALLINPDKFGERGRAVEGFEYDKLAQKTLEEQERKLAEVPPPGAEGKVKAVERSDVKTSDNLAQEAEILLDKSKEQVTALRDSNIKSSGELAREPEVPYHRAEGIVKKSESLEFKPSDESAVAPEEIERLETKKVTEVGKTAAVPRIKANVPIGGGIAEVPVSAEDKGVEKRDELSLQYSNEILSGVKNLIALVQGKVISVEYEKDTNLPQFLNAEIPAGNYTLFLEKLGRFGQVQGPLPSIPTKLNEPIQVRIGLILSK